MTARVVWLCVALLVAGTVWLVGGAVQTITDRPAPSGTTTTSWYHGDGDLIEVTP